MKHLSLVCVAGILALIVVSFVPAQQPAPGPQPVVKAFPPEISHQMDEANKTLDLADAQLKAAQANMAAAQLSVQNILLRAAADVNLTKAERESCPYAKNKNGAWVFNCPPPKADEKKP